MDTQEREHSKYQMESVNKLTEAVTQLNSLHNANKLAARSTVIIACLYNEIDVAASFLSHQQTSLSSVTTTGKPEDDPMMGSIIKEFSKSYNQANKKCKSAQAELVSPVVFAFVSPSVRSTDIKLKEIQRNMLKMTDCFIKLLSQLPNILKTNGDHKDEKLKAIQTFLDGIKMSGHAT